MKSLTVKWSIYLLTLCSFPRCTHFMGLFSNAIEDNMKAMDEIISKSKSYNELVDTFRQNWESPVGYLVERGYIPIEEAKPDKLSRDTIEKMQKEYEGNYNRIASIEGENIISKTLRGTDSQFQNRKGFRERKACSTTTAEPSIVSTEASTCKTAHSETITTTEQIETTTTEKSTCEPVTVNPLSDLEETTPCAPVETTTAITDADENSSTMKDCTPSSSADECEYEDTVTDCYDDKHVTQKTEITTTTQLPSDIGDDRKKVPEENKPPCNTGEEMTTTLKPIDDKPDSGTECFLEKNYGLPTAFPFRFQFDYPPVDYPLNEQRKIESAITALKGSPGAFELAKEIAESTVAEYTHNLSQLANMSKSVRSENDKRKRSENLKIRKTQDRSTKTKLQNPTWYSHPKQWSPQEKPWQSKQAFWHYSPPSLEAWHPDHPYLTVLSHQKMAGKIVQKPLLLKKDHQAMQSHGLKNFKSRFKAEPALSKTILKLNKAISKTPIKEYESKNQFSNLNKKEKSLTGKGSSFFASKSHSARKDFDYFDTNNDDYIYDDSDAYIALNAVYMDSKKDFDKNQRVTHSNSMNSEEVDNATQINQNFYSLPSKTNSDSKVWDILKNGDELNKQFLETVSNSPNGANSIKKDDKMVIDGSLGGDSSSSISYGSPQSYQKWLNSKPSGENVNSQNSNATNLTDNPYLSSYYTNPTDLGNKESHINEEKVTSFQQPISSEISNSNTDINSYGYQENHNEWQHFKPGETETEFFRALEAKYLNEYRKPDNVSNPNLYNTAHHLDWQQPDSNEKTNDENFLSTGTRNKETQKSSDSATDYSESLNYGSQNPGNAFSKSMHYISLNGFNNPSTDIGSVKSVVLSGPNSGNDIYQPANVEVNLDWQNSKESNQQGISSSSNSQKQPKYNSAEGKYADGFSLTVDDISSNYWQHKKGSNPTSNDDFKLSDKSQKSFITPVDTSDILFEKGSGWQFSKPSSDGAIGSVKPEAVAIEKYGGDIGNVYLKLATSANLVKSADSKVEKSKPQHSSDILKPTGSVTKKKMNNMYLNNYLVPTFDSNLKPKNKFLKNANLIAKKAKDTYNYESYNSKPSWKEPHTITNTNANSISNQNYNPLGELSFFDFGKKENTNPIKSTETYDNSKYLKNEANQLKYPSESILNLYRYKNMNKNLEDIFKHDQNQKTIPIKPYSYTDDKAILTRSLRYAEPRVDLTKECKDIVKQAVHNITTSKFPEMALRNLRKRAAHEHDDKHRYKFTEILIKMMHYRKGENIEEEIKKEDLPFKDCLPKGQENFLWMRVKGGTKLNNVITYAKNALDRGEYRTIVWTGAGGGVVKTVSCAEIIKRTHPLYQVTRMCYTTIEEHWIPQLEGLDPIVAKRQIPCLHILMSLEQIDDSIEGLQKPNTTTDYFDHSRCVAPNRRRRVNRNRQQRNTKQTQEENENQQSERTPKERQQRASHGQSQSIPVSSSSGGNSSAKRHWKNKKTKNRDNANTSKVSSLEQKSSEAPQSNTVQEPKKS